MKFIKYILLLFAFPLTVGAQENLPDSLSDDEEKVDSSLITRRNIAKDFNYLDHILDGRYLPHGDQFTKRWNDHLFVEFGAGIQQVVAPSSNYEFTPNTTAHVALGKQFNPKHSLRLSLYGSYAYQKKKEFFMYQLGAKLDHIFDMSSYFAGYDPTRRVGVSTVVGLGAVRSQFAQNSYRDKESSMAFEGHLGLQFKIFAGPQGYINIEPYAGLSTDHIDISNKRNWRGYDAFYGAQLSYVYYLHNNLSPEARAEYLTKRILKDELTADSTLYSWRKPLFIEMANSTHFLSGTELSMGATQSAGFSLALGGWLSPAIALRGTLTNENVVYNHGTSFSGYQDAMTGNYLGARAEALLNPFGFVRHYNWDSKFGAYLVAGLQVGKLWKRTYDNPQTAYFQGYTTGVHLWARLSDGLQFFVEPRYEHLEYHRPNIYKGSNWRYSDNLWGVNAGITVFTKTRKYTDWKIWEERDQSQFMDKFVVGIGGGFNYIPTILQFADTRFKLGYNAGAFLEYHRNALHSVRLTAEGVQHAMNFYKESGTIEKGNYATALVSLDYMLNLTNALNSQDPDLRTFELFAFAGPTALMGVTRVDVTKPYFTANAGVKLLYHVNRHIGVHLTPTFYYLHNQIKKDIYINQRMSSVSLIETLNAGIQYTF